MRHQSGDVESGAQERGDFKEAPGGGQGEGKTLEQKGKRLPEG